MQTLLVRLQRQLPLSRRAINRTVRGGSMNSPNRDVHVTAEKGAEWNKSFVELTKPQRYFPCVFFANFAVRKYRLCPSRGTPFQTGAIVYSLHPNRSVHYLQKRLSVPDSHRSVPEGGREKGAKIARYAGS